ncbi:porin [Sinomicrobium sp. M5D2P9]
MYIRSIILCICLFTVFNHSMAQTDSSWQQKPQIRLSGFMDVFYVYDFNHPGTDYRQPFFFNHNRHNEFNLNLGLVSLALEHEKYRANLAMQAGTYANDNYAAEPGVLKNIFEANIGISLNQKNNLWLDAGILPSHIGFESAVSMDNPTLTRSMLAENSPYFLTGARLTYTPSSTWELAVLVCNGWQRIERLQGNSLLSFGTRVTYSPGDGMTLNWSTFIGTDDPDSTRRMRYFNNVYGQFQLTDRLGITAGFDMGIQQKQKNSSAYDIWLSPVLIGQYTVNENWKTAIRAEYYQDKTGIIIPTGTANGFTTTGLSWNVDYAPIPWMSCRLEGRWLHSRDTVFETKDGTSNNNFFIGTSIAVKFSEVLGRDNQVK